MDKIAKLFVLDDKGDEIGRLVIDLEKIVAMYSTYWLSQQGESDTGTKILREQTESPRDPADEIIKQVTSTLAWYKKQSDGTYYLVMEI